MSAPSPTSAPAAAPARAAGGGPAVFAGSVVTAVVVCALTAAWTGAVAPDVFGEVGPLVRWGLPVVKVVTDLAAALTVGALVLAAVGLRRTDTDAWGRVFRVVSVAAGVWALGSLVVGVLAYADASSQQFDDPAFGSGLWSYLSGSDAGRGYLWTAAVALVVNICALLVGNLRGAGLLSLLAMTGLIPPALAGHSSSAQGSHETAVTSLGLHLLGVTVWVGGLAALVLLRPTLAGDGRLGVVARRYSALALWAYVAVALSGLVNAWIHLGDLSGLGSRYGTVLLTKTGTLAVLGYAGWLHRRTTLADLDRGEDGAFTRLAAVEGFVMAATVGLAVALSRTAPPIPRTASTTQLTQAEIITGFPMPPEPTTARWLTYWQPDLLWVVLLALFVGGYVTGVVRLRRRGDAWPVGRTISWLLGCLVVLYVTSGPPAAYGRVLFSAHMIGHMTLSMATPILLVLGAPVTLLLRATHPRGDGSRGLREWAVAVTESGYIRFLSHPVMVSFLFAGSLVLFYFSPLFEVALRTHVGHELMHVHFLFAGYLMAWVMIGLDPGPHRPTPPLRLVMLFATMAFHAFFGIALIQTTTVLAEGYFGALGRPWGAGLLDDQRTGGGIAWGIGEIPTLALAVILAIQWSQSDGREARRLDRAADRDGDAELGAYNEMLARMAAVDAQQEARDQAAEQPTRD